MLASLFSDSMQLFLMHCQDFLLKQQIEKLWCFFRFQTILAKFLNLCLFITGLLRYFIGFRGLCWLCAGMSCFFSDSQKGLWWVRRFVPRSILPIHQQSSREIFLQSPYSTDLSQIFTLATIYLNLLSPISAFQKFCRIQRHHNIKEKTCNCLSSRAFQRNGQTVKKYFCTSQAADWETLHSIIQPLFKWIQSQNIGEYHRERSYVQNLGFIEIFFKV